MKRIWRILTGKKMVPESSGRKFGNEILVWKCVSKGEKKADEFFRVPSALHTNYKNGQPFSAAGKKYLSCKQLCWNGEEEIWYRDPWGHHEMIGKYWDVYGRKVLYFSIRFPAYDIYDKEYDDRFDRYYFLCEDEKLTLIHHADGCDGFGVTEDVDELDSTVWKRLKEQKWIIW